MMIIFSSIILIILFMASIYYFHTGDEASVGIFSLAVTLIGTIFIAVDPQWRGYGLQQRFIDWSLEVANDSGAKYIHATVNPDNNHSGQNFIKRGFAVKKTVSKYGGLTRNLLELKVN